jgi:hypothetical protein
MKKRMLPAILLAIACALSACGNSETTAEETQETQATIAIIEQAATAQAEETESVDGIVASESGSAADYAGYYVLTSRTGDFPYNSFEILKEDSEYIIFYSDSGFSMNYLDYSEQRFLEGNSLMTVSLSIDDADVEFAVEPYDQGGEKGMEIIGQGDFFEMTASFVLDDGTEDELIISDLWTDLNATFMRDDSSEYSNGVLWLSYDGNYTVSFEFGLMEGSESEESATEVTLSGEMTITEEDKAVYDITDDNGERQIIFLGISQSEDGLVVDVSTTGEFDIYPDGHYVYI